MKKVLMVTGIAYLVTAFSVLAGGDSTAPAAIAQPGEREATVMLFYNPSKTKLDALALTGGLTLATGKKEYENEGDYTGVMFDIPLKIKKFGIYGCYLTGVSDEIQNGNFTAPNYDWTDWMVFSRANPLTKEEVTKMDLMGTYQLLGYASDVGSAYLDLMAGYWILDSKPATSKANVYNGFSYGLKGICSRKAGPTKLSVDGMVNYVPAYNVAGNVDGELADDDIIQYRAGVACAFMERCGVSVGYQGMRLRATAVKDSSRAVVSLAGWYIGAIYNF
jgi:hypothetical protein